MTIEKISRETQELRDFGDALRSWLGLAPLYNRDVLRRETDRTYAEVYALPGATIGADWLIVTTGALSTRESFREQGIRRAERRKALMFRDGERVAAKRSRS